MCRYTWPACRASTTLAREWNKAEDRAQAEGSERPIATGISPPHEMLQCYIYSDLLRGSASGLWEDLPQVQALTDDGLLPDAPPVPAFPEAYEVALQEHCEVLAAQVAASC